MPDKIAVVTGPAAGWAETSPSTWPGRDCPGDIRLLEPAEPVTRRIFTVSRRGGERQPAVRVVLGALSAEAAGFSRPATTAA